MEQMQQAASPAKSSRGPSLRDVASASGASLATTHRLLTRGLLPAYSLPSRRLTEPMAAALVPVLGTPLASVGVADQMKKDPAKVLEWAQYLAQLAQLVLDDQAADVAATVTAA